METCMKGYPGAGLFLMAQFLRTGAQAMTWVACPPIWILQDEFGDTLHCVQCLRDSAANQQISSEAARLWYLTMKTCIWEWGYVWLKHPNILPMSPWHLLSYPVPNIFWIYHILRSFEWYSFCHFGSCGHIWQDFLPANGPRGLIPIASCWVTKVRKLWCKP